MGKARSLAALCVAWHLGHEYSINEWLEAHIYHTLADRSEINEDMTAEAKAIAARLNGIFGHGALPRILSRYTPDYISHTSACGVLMYWQFEMKTPASACT